MKKDELFNAATAGTAASDEHPKNVHPIDPSLSEEMGPQDPAANVHPIDPFNGN